jgi:hypothetical protein
MKTLREYIDRLDEISRKGINEEQWYAHDFGQWQSDANAKNLDIVQSETDETGNNLQAFNAVDSSGAVVGHFDGVKGSGVLTNSPEEYQSAVAVEEGFSQKANDAYTQDVASYYSGASTTKELGKLFNPIKETDDDINIGPVIATTDDPCHDNEEELDEDGNPDAVARIIELSKNK